MKHNLFKIHLICAARPNFMKVAPLYHKLKEKPWCELSLIHTGQHYDATLSDQFFKDLELPVPDHMLNVGSGSHAKQTAETMIAYETVFSKDSPDLTIVVGDVNPSLACAITAKKHGIMLAHVEAGLRSFDASMPEEINRVLIDRIADILWTPSEDANDNLRKEGIPHHKIKFVGNIMIDSLEMLRSKIDKSELLKSFGFEGKKYSVLTLHRPFNVDEPSSLKAILQSISNLKCPVIFPVHPRTQKTIAALDWQGIDRTLFNLVSALSYIDFMKIVVNSHYVITDSGGIQEETSYLNVPCFTLRDNTERPITLSLGTNKLITLKNLNTEVDSHLNKLKDQVKNRIPLWDGNTAERIVHDLETNYV